MTDTQSPYRVGDQHPATAQQPPPTQSKHVPIVWLVTHDLERRAAAGAAKYGDKLRGFNGRDALLDAYQEALDLAMYLRQAIYERDHAPAPPWPRILERLAHLEGRVQGIQDIVCLRLKNLESRIETYLDDAK